MRCVRSILGPGLLLAAGISVGLGATDEAKPTASDTILATRQGLAALKSDSTLPSTDNRLPTPSFETPMLPMPALAQPPLIPPASQPNKLAPPTGSSGSWLIDAMQKNGPQSASDPRRARSGKAGADFKSDTTTLSGLGTAETDDKNDLGQTERPSPDRGNADVTSPVKDAPNPLAGFMAGWMTPHDFNLLYKTGETGGTMGFSHFPADGPGDQALLAPGTEFSTVLPGGSLAAAGLPRPGQAERMENPYLQLPPPPAQVPGGPGEFTGLQSPLPAPPAPPPLQAEAGAPSAAAGAPVNDLPQILKRDDSAKYFPQLKHF